MKPLTDLSHDEARAHFLKGESYFNSDLPRYISFEPLLSDVASEMAGRSFRDFLASKPEELPHVNYSFTANKDGRFAWRPYELIHPAIYTSLVDLICCADHWAFIVQRFAEFGKGVVECCSAPVMSVDQQSDTATQIRSWWQRVEQRSLALSLDYTHVLHTDVTDCYGSLYTHSIPWALHGVELAKERRGDNNLLGNKIDRHIQASRYGQTNGIAQGSVLMDLIAEIVLGFVDLEITESDVLKNADDVRVLRYRDDYRIFAQNDQQAEIVLKVVSDKLRLVGMKLGSAKTMSHSNVVEGSVKVDKLAGITLQDLGEENAKSVQKRLLRLHSFGQRYPNSGALRRLVSDFHSSVAKLDQAPDDLDVLVAIATDIAVVSPGTFPAVAGILSHLIRLAPQTDQTDLWNRVRRKMGRVPYNGYLEVWLQRVIRPMRMPFASAERICKIVNGESVSLWDSEWISNPRLKASIDNVAKIVVADPDDMDPSVYPEEVALFKRNAWAY